VIGGGCWKMPPRLVFVRHGEAAHNPLLVKGNYKAKDPAEMDMGLLRAARSIVDPSLTETGRAQASALGEKMVADGMAFDLCVTTPLARAIETAHLAFGKVASRFLVTPDLCETATGPTGLKLAGPQRGVSKAEMMQKHAFIATWDVSLISEGANWVLGDPIVPSEPAGGEIGGAWHNPTPVEERLQPMATWLKARPEQTIVVVGHSGVFDKLIGKDMKNCEVRPAPRPSLSQRPSIRLCPSLRLCCTAAPSAAPSAGTAQLVGDRSRVLRCDRSRVRSFSRTTSPSGPDLSPGTHHLTSNGLACRVKCASVVSRTAPSVASMDQCLRTVPVWRCWRKVG
jgi:broad specificity phosphatase PhoE